MSFINNNFISLYLNILTLKQCKTDRQRKGLK